MIVVIIVAVVLSWSTPAL